MGRRNSRFPRVGGSEQPVNHYDYEFGDDHPERGKPKPELVYREKDHGLVVRALYWHKRTGSIATDQSIYDCVVRFKGSKAISPSGARTRRKELVELGLVAKGEAVGRTEAGRNCSTWVLTESGTQKADAEFRAANQAQLEIGVAA